MAANGMNGDFYGAATWPDGTVRLPDAVEAWLDGHFDGEKGDDADELAMMRNATAVAMWALIHRQGDPDMDQAALAVFAEAAEAAHIEDSSAS